MDAQKLIARLAADSRRASAVLAQTRGEQRNAALLNCAIAIRQAADILQQANSRDLARSKEFGLSSAMVDRLTLSDKLACSPKTVPS
jgi:glutamate-5-semialdehyde dehydrogenase